MNRRIALMSVLSATLILEMVCSSSPEERASGGGRTVSQGTTVDLEGEFNLGGERSREPHDFRLETHTVNYGPDGARERRATFRLDLSCTPGLEGDHYVCRKFSFEAEGNPERTIPALAGWEYTMRRGAAPVDEKNQLLTLDQARFQALKDDTAQPVSLGVTYAAYSAFVDFHSFFEMLAEQTSERPGIQELHSIGERTSFTPSAEAPVHLLGAVSEGSSFKSGEITMEFLGLSLVDGKRCALIRYDLGEGSFRMLMEPAPGTKGVPSGTGPRQGQDLRGAATRFRAPARGSHPHPS